MKKRKNKFEPSPLEALRYLESMRKLSEDKDEPTVMISLRIPGNILKTIKNKAKVENKKILINDCRDIAISFEEVRTDQFILRSVFVLSYTNKFLHQPK